MAILSVEELSQQAEDAYVQGQYEVALLYSETPYSSATEYADILADEVPPGTGGYARLTYTYASGDILAYSNGQPLSTKIANFVHDGSSEQIIFNYVALIRYLSSTYTLIAIESVGDTVILENGQIAKIDISILHGALQ